MSLRLAAATVLLLAATLSAAPQEGGNRRPATAPAASPASPIAAESTTRPAPRFDTEWEPAEEWRRRGQTQLKGVLERLRQREEAARRSRTSTYAGMARNVILFIGDGMGVATSTATGIMVGGEGYRLSWERFPFTGLSKTYSVDHQVPDSASTATAMLTGAKTHSKVLGLDARANVTTCDRETNEDSALETLTLWAQQAGKATGVVTTARITHATPAAAYARINHRDWECDTKMTPEARGCVRDIARQLVEEAPGRDLRVVLGGGRRQLGASGPEDPDEDDSCVRGDGRNLTAVWAALPGKREYVSTRQQLLEPDLTHRADYLLGLFAAGHMAYEAERVASGGDQPSLREMTRVALRALRRHGRANGFFLLVEGARVDMAHHQNYARMALLEAQELDEAVHLALDETDPEDTLIVVTGDHSHAMTINGYPERGTDVLGIAYPMGQRYDDKAVKYETLTYSTGPGARDHEGKRIQDVPEEQRRQLRYRHQAGLFTGEDETHAGEDVPVYAHGAGSDIFTGVYEQSYIGTAMAYAAGVGVYSNEAHEATGVAASLSTRDKSAAPASAPAVAALLLALLGATRLLS